MTNRVEAPLWSYQLGLEQGWIPTDPRLAVGKCASLGVSGDQFDGTYQPWQTGGAGAGTIAATATAQFPWPPAQLSNVAVAADLLPSYTPTGTVATLPPPTLTASASKSIDVGDGWFDTKDTAGEYTAIAGCTYPDPWDAVSVAVPAQCGTVGAAAAAVTPTPTAATTATTDSVDPDVVATATSIPRRSYRG